MNNLMRKNGQPLQTKLFDYLAHGIFMTLYGIVKYFPPPIGNWLRYLCLWPFAKNLKNVRIGEGVTIWYPYRLSIGRNTTINEFCHINAFGGVTIGSGVRMGHHTTIISSDHVFDDPDRWIKDQGLTAAPTVIEDDVLFGAHVIVVKGVTIGKGAVIGAGSVVTRSVPPYAIVVGNPARQLKSRKPDLTSNLSSN